MSSGSSGFPAAIQSRSSQMPPAPRMMAPARAVSRAIFRTRTRDTSLATIQTATTAATAV